MNTIDQPVHSPIILDAESIAAQCIVCITKCIDVLRSRFDSTKVPLSTVRTASGELSNPPPGEALPVVESIPLLSNFSDVRSEISSLYNEARSKLNRPSAEFSHSDLSCDWHDESWLPVAPTRNDNDKSVRHQLIYDIFLPALATLALCYDVLDSLPVTPPTRTAHSKHRPPPPVGMLSIQNYTDVACLIELIMCWSVVPLLPPHVLLSLDERVRYTLPKSIQGRLSPRCLVWAATLPSCDSDGDSVIYNELGATVTVVGRLLLLDRFRPMLLPRHLPDLMAAILYRHKLKHSGQETARTMNRLCWELLGGSDGGSTDPSNTAALASRVDTSWHVQSYQTLLRKGRDAPAWLQTAVSALLCHVAATNVSVLVSVFCPVSDGMNVTATVLRLARAIVPIELSTNDHDAYLARVCGQLVAALDAILPDTNASLSSHSGSTSEHLIQTQRSMNVQITWAVLDLLPASNLERLFDPAILNGAPHDLERAMPHDRVQLSGFHRVIRRLAILLRERPTTAALYTVSKVCRLFMKPLTSYVDVSQEDDAAIGFRCTFLGAVIRLASTPSVIQSTMKEDAIYTVRLFMQATMETNFPLADGASRVPGGDAAAVALLHAIAPSQWDFSGWSFQIGGRIVKDSSVEDLWLVRDRTNDNLDFARHAPSVSARAKLVCEIFGRARSSETSQDTVAETHGSDQLSSIIFQTLLMTYFSADRAVTTGDFLAHSHFHIVALVGLPILCEHCPLESLLCHGNDRGIFEIIQIVFDSVVDRFAVDLPKPSVRGATPSGALDRFRARMASAVSVVLTEGVKPQLFDESSVGPDDETRLSVASIVLTLLVGILELGEQQRTVAEEDVLQSFAAPLKTMSTMTTHGQVSDEISTLLGQISEVASYAAALIATRPNGNSVVQTTQLDSSADAISLAESDLSSTEPPLRARSMVQLRRLVHTMEQSGSMAVRVKHAQPTNGAPERIEALWRILNLSIRALNDSESYVYLAAIHTIVAVVESEPSIFVKVIGSAVAVGSTRRELGLDNLSMEQRAKLTESLSFLIRRRGSFDQELLFLFEILASGSKPFKTEDSDHQADYIQEVTHDYFINECDPLSNSQSESKLVDDYWDSVQLRVRTGGPLFNVEENDLVRAASIALVGELLAVVTTDVIAQRCSILIDCSITTLRLESSRPIRRAGASLARELYAALVRELNHLHVAVHEQKDSSIPLSVAMVNGREDLLQALLERIVNSKDLNDVGQNERRYDPATVARCQEAIALRQEAVSGGILSAGRIVLEANSIESQGIARLIKKSTCTEPTRQIVNIEEVI